MALRQILEELGKRVVNHEAAAKRGVDQSARVAGSPDAIRPETLAYFTEVKQLWPKELAGVKFDHEQMLWYQEEWNKLGFQCGVCGRPCDRPTARHGQGALPPEQFAVFARLRTLRKAISEREGTPVFAVFSNAQLAEIVQRGCQSLAELKAISGVGESRVAKYGAEVLAALKEGGAAT